MTNIYFVRHAQSDTGVHDDVTRPLTDEGLRDAVTVADHLACKGIDRLYSSPYKRTLDTIGVLAERLDMEITTDSDLRERKAGKWFGGHFFEYVRKQWEDFDFAVEGGESLGEVQERNLRALDRILEENTDKKVVIATHGTALSTILNHFYPQFGYEDFLKIVDLMPLIIRLDFDNKELAGCGLELALRKEYKE